MMSILRGHRVDLSLLGDERAKGTMRGIVTDLGGAVTTAVSKANVVVFHKGPAASLDIARALSLPVVTADWVYACNASGTVEGYAAFMYTDETPPRAETFEAGYDAHIHGEAIQVPQTEATLRQLGVASQLQETRTQSDAIFSEDVLKIENGLDHEKRAGENQHKERTTTRDVLGNGPPNIVAIDDDISELERGPAFTTPEVLGPTLSVLVLHL